LRAVFIEIYEPRGAIAAEAAFLGRFGFKLASKTPVARLRGGVYPGLYNCVFTRA
jgi:hypothetical protein